MLPPGKIGYAALSALGRGDQDSDVGVLIGGSDSVSTFLGEVHGKPRQPVTPCHNAYAEGAKHCSPADHPGGIGALWMPLTIFNCGGYRRA